MKSDYMIELLSEKVNLRNEDDVLSNYVQLLMFHNITQRYNTINLLLFKIFFFIRQDLYIIYILMMIFRVYCAPTDNI